MSVLDINDAKELDLHIQSLKETCCHLLALNLQGVISDKIYEWLEDDIRSAYQFMEKL